MKCVKCGMENGEGVVNCSYCGNALVNTNGLVQPTVLQAPVYQPVNNTTVVSQEQSSNMILNSSSNSSAVEPTINSVSNTVSESVSVPSQVQSVSIMDNASLSNAIGQPVNSTNDIQVNNIGSVLPTNGQINNNDEKKNKMLKIILIIMIVLLLSSIGIAVWVYFKGQEKIEEHNKMMENRVEITWTPGSQNKYTFGDEVILVDNSSWYFVSQDGDMITLLAKDVYGDSTNFSNSANDYETSLVKNILETKYLPSVTDSLSNNGGNVDGLKVRLISLEEVKNITNIGENTELNESYKWLYQPGNYWIDSDENKSYGYAITDWNTFGSIETEVNLVSGRKFSIRPVIEINSSNIKM